MTWKTLSCSVPLQKPSEEIETVVSAFTGPPRSIHDGCASLRSNDATPYFKDVLNDVSECIQPGQMCLVLGPAGSGSSLLLSQLAGCDVGKLVDVTGQALYNGEEKLNGFVDPAHFLHIVGQYDHHIPQAYCTRYTYFLPRSVNGRSRCLT